MSDIVEDLLAIKEEIAHTEKEISINKGKVESLIERLKEEHDCASLEDASIALGELKKSIRKKEKEVEVILESLKDLGWDI